MSSSIRTGECWRPSLLPTTASCCGISPVAVKALFTPGGKCRRVQSRRNGHGFRFRKQYCQAFRCRQRRVQSHSGWPRGRSDRCGLQPGWEILASASLDGTIKFWDCATWREKATLTGSPQGIVRVAFSPDGQTVAGESKGGPVKLWAADSGREIATLSCRFFGDFSPDGQTVACGSDSGTIKLWHVSGRPRESRICCPFQRSV